MSDRTQLQHDVAARLSSSLLPLCFVAYCRSHLATIIDTLSCRRDDDCTSRAWHVSTHFLPISAAAWIHIHLSLRSSEASFTSSRPSSSLSTFTIHWFFEIALQSASGLSFTVANTHRQEVSEITSTSKCENSGRVKVVSNSRTTDIVDSVSFGKHTHRVP